MRKSILSLILVNIFLMIFLSSCKPFWEEDKKKVAKVVAGSLHVYPAEFTITKLEESVPLGITAKADDGSTLSDVSLVNWQSSDETVATINDNGVVTAKASGQTMITAILGTQSQSFTVTVNESGKTINGQISYEDWTYDATGLVGKNYKPVRYAVLQINDADGHIIQSGESSESGSFDFGYVIYPNANINVLASVKNSVAAGFIVKDLEEYVYSVSTSVDVSADSYDVKISQSSGVAGAFNILDVMTTAAEFSREVLGVDAQNLAMFWEVDNYHGTHYCNNYDAIDCFNGEGIYVLNIGPYQGYTELDTDEFDDDVLMHEFGHYLVENYALDDSPGGCHNLTDNNLDLRLAWSEGLGTFFPIAIKDWLKRTNPSLMSMLSSEEVTLYLDTWQTRQGAHEPLISFDIANFDDNDPPDIPEPYFYASSEVAILKILWGLSQSFGMDRVWDVVENYFQTSQYPTSLASFWDGFLANSQFQASELTALQSIFNERQVYYQDDSFELDNSIDFASALTLNEAPVDHYLYRAPTGLDVDFFAVDIVAGKTYQIKTQELRNGIDTKIRILDGAGDIVSMGGQLLENDDAVPGSYYRVDEYCGGSRRIFVDKTSLASSVTFTAESSGQYFIEVSHHEKFSHDENFTGHYGSYQLDVSEVVLQ